MKLSVIIVSYNAADFLHKCLKSVEENLPKNAEVIVLDNASPKREIEALPVEFPKIKFILNNENVGFSKGNNLAVKQAKGEYVLILNPDTIVYDNFFTSILNFADSTPKVGAIGVRMLDGNNIFLPESKRNIPTAWSSFAKLFGQSGRGKGYYATHINEIENGKVEVLSGACMLMKKSVYNEVGGFDEAYFMYGEDIDLSYTLTQNGYTNYYLGEITITHFKGESTIKDKKYLDRFYGAMEIFIQKYYKKKNPLQYYIMLLGLRIKYFLELKRL